MKNRFWRDNYGWKLGYQATVLFVITCGAVAIIGMGVRQLTLHIDTAQCHSFGQQSDREVKFVMYTFWTWDCLTPTNDGKWISIRNLRELG